MPHKKSLNASSLFGSSCVTIVNKQIKLNLPTALKPSGALSITGASKAQIERALN